MRRAGLPLAVLWVAACGGGSSPPPVRTGPVDPTATAAGPDDVVVARVDGRPVWGSCVAAQAAGRHVDRAAALADCVDFELLAGAAIARGLTADPDVADAARAAAATRLIDRDFTARYQHWTDLPDSLTGPALAQSADRMNRPESRASYLVRLEIPKAAAGSPLDLAGGEAIKAAYATIADRKDLFPPDVLGAAQAATQAVPALRDELAREGTKFRLVGVFPDPTQIDLGLQPYYRAALFAIPAIGQLAPIQRSPWGWDLILYTDFRHPPPMTRDQLATSMFESLRLHYFGVWTNAIAKKHQVAVLADEAALRKLWGPPAPPRPQ